MTVAQFQGTRAGRRIVVLGAGIGGLAAAIALSRRGHDVVVVERRPALERLQVGGGLILWPNAVAVLRQLGVAEAVQATGLAIQRMTVQSDSGTMLAVPPIGSISGRHDAGALAITRGALFEALAAAIPAGSLQLGMNAVSVEDSPGQIVVSCTDGTRFTGDVLVGADGRNSITRNSLLGAPSDYPGYAGYSLWRGIVDHAAQQAAPATFAMTWGCGLESYAFPLLDDRAYWALAAFGPPQPDLAGEALKAQALERVRGWKSAIVGLIEATETSAITRTNIYGGTPLPVWGHGRVTLLGDAAHPMTTTLGMGACQAIEDAVVLGDSLDSNSDPQAALRAYEDRRRLRVADVMAVAAGFERPARAGDRVQCWFRNRGVAVYFHPLAVRRTGYWRVMTEGV